MAQHRREGERSPDRRREPRPHDAHIQGKDEKIISRDVEKPAEEHRGGGKPRAAVVAQEGGQHLVEDEYRHGELHRPQVLPRKRQKRLVRAEEQEHPPIEKNDSRPAEGGENHRSDKCRREIIVRAALTRAALSPGDAEQHAAADPREQPEAVDDIPDGRDDGQRRRAVGPMVLADDRHVHDAVNRADHRAAEGRSEISEIYGADPAAQ